MRGAILWNGTGLMCSGWTFHDGISINMRGQGKRAYMLNGKNLNKKRYSKSGMIITLLFAALYFFTASFYSYGAENESTVLAEATCLTFVIPAEFV